MNFNKNKKIIVAMSGGVDSSVASLLLLKQKYQVAGLTAIMHYTGQETVQKAAKACELLGIQHIAIDLQDVFQNTVINYFETSYKRGLTPNPCTFCNKKIKWGKMTDFVFNELGADFYATGHYARIKKQEESYRLYRGHDLTKDQSYMLYALDQADLARTIFPLGEINKSEIKKIAEQNGLSLSNNKESQDICFITPPETTSSYLLNKFGEQEGDIIEYKTGKLLGKHKGTFNYTIGQRKGIGVSAPEPLYIISCDNEKNIIYAGYKNDLTSKEFNVTEINWQQKEYTEQDELNAMIKIRYNSPAQKARIFMTGTNSAHIKLEEPKLAITPGQIAVFYDLNNEYVLGGGTITF